MSRINVIAALLAVFCIVDLPLLCGQDDDWRQRQQQMEQTRREADQRYQDWIRERDKRNETWRAAPGQDQDRVLELPDSGLKPGQYTVRLPFGLGGVRFNVAEEARRAAAPDTWGDRSYGDVSYRARQLSTEVRNLQIELQRTGQQELIAEAAKIYGQAVGFLSAATTRRPAAELQAQFKDFDALWHPFSHKLERTKNVGQAVQQRVAAIDQLEEGLHRILAIAPAAPYDRPLVAALTNQLANSTSHLLDDLKEERQTQDMRAFTIRAQRVKQYAADLDATVRQNAPFATIVEEYQEFDHAWHRLLEQARNSPEIDAHVRKVARQVHLVDTQLHQELFVNVPIVNNRDQLQYLTAGIAKAADHLAEDIAEDTGRGKRDLRYDARVFAATARELHRVLKDRATPQDEQRAFRELLDSWQHLYADIRDLRGERFEHSQAIANQINADVKRLQDQWRG
jgi:hypothetical protein